MKTSPLPNPIKNHDLLSRRNELPSGGFRELVSLFIPIALLTFSNCLFLIIEKLLLARISLQAMEAAVNVAYTCQIFQAPCVALAMMTQVFVGRWCGSCDFKTIGSGVWQFIWFAFLSMVLTAPMSFIYGEYYFRGTELEEIALPYFYFLVSINFLFPLGATLTCFYLGQGKTTLVIVATVGSQLTKLILAYPLIFGWDPWIPTLGLMGGAVSTFIAQGGFCLFLFFTFLSQANNVNFHSRAWHFRPRFFWECIQPGILRGLNRILNFTCWASIAHLMTIKGGDYLVALSIGGSIFLFLPFIGDAICQAQITIVSKIIGSQRFESLKRSFRSASFLVLITMIVSGIPFLLFPVQTFHILFPTVLMEDSMIRSLFQGIWASFAFFTYGYVPISFILAFKDTKFSLFMGGMSWINGFLLMYILLSIVEIPPSQFWLALSLMHGSNVLFYYMRMRWLETKEGFTAHLARQY